MKREKELETSGLVCIKLHSGTVQSDLFGIWFDMRIAKQSKELFTMLHGNGLLFGVFCIVFFIFCAFLLLESEHHRDESERRLQKKTPIQPIIMQTKCTR